MSHPSQTTPANHISLCLSLRLLAHTCTKTTKGMMLLRVPICSTFKSNLLLNLYLLIHISDWLTNMEEQGCGWNIMFEIKKFQQENRVDFPWMLLPFWPLWLMTKRLLNYCNSHKPQQLCLMLVNMLTVISYTKLREVCAQWNLWFFILAPTLTC